MYLGAVCTVLSMPFLGLTRQPVRAVAVSQPAMEVDGVVQEDTEMQREIDARPTRVTSGIMNV